MLARRVLVERVLHRDPHRLQRPDRPLAQGAGDVGGRQVEVRAGVERHRTAVVARGEVEELHLRRHVVREPARPRPLEVATQHLAGVALERRAVEVEDVAEDARLRRARIGPRQHLEAVGIGPRQHVALLDARVAVDRRAVERHALVEGVLKLHRRDGEALQLTEDVGEPQPHEAHPALLDRPQDVVALGLHPAQSRRTAAVSRARSQPSCSPHLRASVSRRLRCASALAHLHRPGAPPWRSHCRNTADYGAWQCAPGGAAPCGTGAQRGGNRG